MGSPDIGNAGKGYGDMMVVFDVDGTLFDTKEEIIRSLDIVLERYGIKKISPEEADLFIGPPITVSLPRYRGIGLQQAADITREFREIYKGHVAGSPPYAGARDVLERLRAAGIRIGIATNKPSSQVDVMIGTYGLEDHFDVIKTKEDQDRSKADLLAEIKKEFPDEDRYLMVGDTMGDLEAAEEAGFGFIEAMYGYGAFPGPNRYRIREIKDIWAILELSDIISDR